MYKLLLCWRYLRTRYLAMVCIISVMLGVATLIVVNSVMSGFSTKLRDRLHGLLADVVIESRGLDGFPNANEHMKNICKSPIGDRIEAMTATVEVFAMLQYRVGSQTVTRPVRLMGIDPVARAKLGGFHKYLLRQNNVAEPSFNLPPEATWRQMQLDRRFTSPTPPQDQASTAWTDDGTETQEESPDPPPPTPPESSFKMPRGVILGNAIASYRQKGSHAGDPRPDVYLLQPGDDVVLTTVSAVKMLPVFDRFVVCDYFKSEMSEYDANYVFVPLEHLQHLRTMGDNVTSIQIKLKDEQDTRQVVDELGRMFPEEFGFIVQSWEEKQGPLLGAINIEKRILNLLLFMIIAVAGFGILAIFSMIVVEKTRDIGILKALGASNRGILSIFLTYGLLLGVVGAGLGTALGLTFTIYINDIEKGLAHITGQDIFPRDVYYFIEIPTDIQPWNVVLVNVGAILIAVIFSVLPALRAAMLHPVRALRYE